MKSKSFSLGLMILESACLKNAPEFTKESKEVWWKLLKDIPDELFLNTINEIVKLNIFFPAIGEIRTKIVEKLETLPEKAWYDFLELTKKSRWMFDLWRANNNDEIIAKFMTKDLFKSIMDAPAINLTSLKRDFYALYKNEQKKKLQAIQIGNLKILEIEEKRKELKDDYKPK